MSLRYIVTGAPRSGTGYASRVLTAMGLNCGHESVYGLRPDPNRHHLLGDSSWLGLVAAETGHFTGTVIFQHRDPRLVASSLVEGVRHMSMSDPYLLFMLSNSDLGMFEPGSDKSVRHWASTFVVDWMERCRRVADLSWSVDDLSRDPVMAAHLLIQYLPEVLGRYEGAEPARRVSTSYNHRSDYEPFDWRGFAVAELAAGMGYR